MFMYHTLVHTVLLTQKYLLPLIHIHIHIYTIQWHSYICKVKYSSFLAMKTVTFRGNCEKGICLPLEILQKEKLIYKHCVDSKDRVKDVASYGDHMDLIKDIF